MRTILPIKSQRRVRSIFLWSPIVSLNTRIWLEKVLILERFDRIWNFQRIASKYDSVLIKLPVLDMNITDEQDKLSVYIYGSNSTSKFDNLDSMVLYIIEKTVETHNLTEHERLSVQMQIKEIDDGSTGKRSRSFWEYIKGLTEKEKLSV